MGKDTGEWLYIAPEPHKCDPPTYLFVQQEPPGSVWRCNCGTLWYLDRFRIWTRAGFLRKRKYRNYKKED